MSNKAIIASAGSGKTRYVIQASLSLAENIDNNILVLTYTIRTQNELLRRLGNKPANISIKGWCGFLMQCLEPHYFFTGMCQTEGVSGVKHKSQFQTVYYSEEEFDKHYFNIYQEIYSDKMSKLFAKDPQKIIADLESKYTHIFIDEFQDLSGYDLEVLKLLFESKITITLVGDPRQTTYKTNYLCKNKKYVGFGFISFLKKECNGKIEVDDDSYNINYRCIQPIIDEANKLYPDLKPVISGNNKITSHDGIYKILQRDLFDYIQTYNPMQLRWSALTKVAGQVLNFGESKGTEYERVLIYPTKDIKKWCYNSNTILSEVTKSKLYVAITRAKQSVAFVI